MGKILTDIRVNTMVANGCHLAQGACDYWCLVRSLPLPSHQPPSDSPILIMDDRRAPAYLMEVDGGFYGRFCQGAHNQTQFYLQSIHFSCVSCVSICLLFALMIKVSLCFNEETPQNIGMHSLMCKCWLSLNSHGN